MMVLICINVYSLSQNVSWYIVNWAEQTVEPWRTPVLVSYILLCEYHWISHHINLSINLIIWLSVFFYMNLRNIGTEISSERLPWKFIRMIIRHDQNSKSSFRSYDQCEINYFGREWTTDQILVYRNLGEAFRPLTADCWEAKSETIFTLKIQTPTSQLSGPLYLFIFLSAPTKEKSVWCVGFIYDIFDFTEKENFFYGFYSPKTGNYKHKFGLCKPDVSLWLNF